MAKRAKHAPAARKNEPQIAVMAERYFGLAQQGTDVRTEFIAGATTFLTMVYIVFVNPIILGKAGMDPGAVFVATCVAAAVSTFVMAFYANYPIAVAPGMGLNAFFAFTVVIGIKGERPPAPSLRRAMPASMQLRGWRSQPPERSKTACSTKRVSRSWPAA
jgi:xanthine/uracil/vitamin C permease (AzgA family)